MHRQHDIFLIPMALSDNTALLSVIKATLSLDKVWKRSPTLNTAGEKSSTGGEKAATAVKIN